MGIATVAVFSDADAGAPFVKFADEAVRIGPPPARESYLVINALLDAARVTGASAVHPGYGFLSENAAFAEAVTEAGLVFIGPPAQVIGKLGSKQQAKRIAQAAGVPTVPGYEGDDQSNAAMLNAAKSIGLPLLTVGIITGAWWAKEAWGAYWQWDPKETAALVSWTVYAMYMHLHTRNSWRGVRSAWMSVLGFITIIFCYLGVNIWVSGLHSYKM